jgi:hypothetical protein
MVCWRTEEMKPGEPLVRLGRVPLRLSIYDRVQRKSTFWACEMLQDRLVPLMPDRLRAQGLAAPIILADSSFREVLFDVRPSPGSQEGSPTIAQGEFRVTVRPFSQEQVPIRTRFGGARRIVAEALWEPSGVDRSFCTSACEPCFTSMPDECVGC